MRLMTAGEAPAVPVALSHQSSPDKRGFFENHPPSPSLPLKKGLHLSPKSSLLRREDLKPGRLGLYSQTSSRPVGVARGYRRNRIAIVCAPRERGRIGEGRIGKGSDWVLVND